MEKNLVHLHVHTGYSFLDGMCKIEELTAKAKEYGMKALAITDHNHLGGTYEFQKQCKKAKIKPILGYEGYYSENTDIINQKPEERKKDACQKALEKGVITQEEYEVYIESKKKSGITKKSIEEKIKDYLPDLRQYHVIFLAMNQTGWKNLIKLQSESAINCTYNERFTCNDELIEKYNEGIICSTACIASRIAAYINKENSEEKAEAFIQKWHKIFADRLYLEMQPLYHPDQIRVNAFYIRMSEKYNIPLIITNDVHYISKEDHDAHDTLLCIGTGQKKSYDGPDRMRYSNEFWFRNYTEIIEALEKQYKLDQTTEKLLPENYIEICKTALQETINLSERIEENINIESKIPLIPKVKLPKGTTPEKELTERCFISLFELAKKDSYVKEHMQEYRERLWKELDVINSKGFASYMLVVDEYVTWANKNGCVTGPGRGSAAGSLALFLIGVTKNTDPMKYHLLFERFLTKDRTALPDIDCDFDYYHRDDVIRHLEDYYGKECVAHIGTYTMSGVKSGIKDVCRVLEISFAESNEISKKLDEILDTPQPKFKDYDNLKNEENQGDLEKWKKFNELETKYSEIFKLARKFEGLKRNFGVHASGILVMPMPVTDMMPIRIADGTSVCLYTGPEVEELNCVKCDILGLKTISVIVKTIEKVGINIDELYSKIKTDDPGIFEMLSAGKSEAVFQLESDLFKSALKMIKPTDINDIVAITAALRPGPLSLQSHVHYAKRKNKTEEITYPLKNTEHIFKDTYGLALYQEQLMRISTDCFGFNQNQADSLTRKILAKKKKDKMEMLRRMFIFGKKNTEGPEGWENNPDLPWYDPNGKQYGDEIEGGLARGYSKEELEKFNKDIQAYASYLFNLSHSVSYSYISVLTAYLKKYYPTEFMAAVLSIQDEEKIEKYVGICKKEGITILAPDINISGKDFTPIPEKQQIYFGFSSIKGIGETAAEEIIKSRPFESLQEIFEKLPKKIMNKRVATALAKSGALDRFDKDKNRYNLINQIYDIRKDKDERLIPIRYTENSCIKFEKETLSAAITHIPYWDKITPGQKIKEPASISDIRFGKDKSGNKIAFIKLKINNSDIEAIAFSGCYHKYSEVLDPENNPYGTIIVTGKKNEKNNLIIEKAEQ